MSTLSKKPQNVDDWLTKQEAAAVLGMAEKSLDRMATRGEIQKTMRKRVGLAPQAVFHPGDIERAKAERERQPFVMPATGNGTAGPTGVPALSSSGGAAVSLPAVLQTLAEAIRPDGVRLAEKIHLTITEASAYAGLPKAHLRRLIADKKLPALKTGAGWRIRRRDLEAL